MGNSIVNNEPNEINDKYTVSNVLNVINRMNNINKITNPIICNKRNILNNTSNSNQK